MDKLFVYGDFDWLERPELIGELSFESIRGNATYGFSYSKKWLSAHPNVFLSEDLQNFPGVQYTQPQKDIFSCFSDALPDRWGRTLLLRREQLKAAEEKRAVRRLTSFDLLKGIDDASRMGSFRFAETPGGDFINCETDFRVPPFTKINELMLAAHEIEASEAKSILPKEKWINQLIHPGTSLGGARPKASVLDEDGKLTVAKFPSRKDNHDVAQWEHFSHYLAKKAGINAAATKTVSASNYHLLLSRRFDRTNDGKRIHFASALTLLGLNDGDNASSGYGYLDTPLNGALGLTEYNRQPNNNLKPEKTSEWELGLTANFLSNRIGIDFAYYDKLTKNQIIAADVAPETRYTSAVRNVGEISNKGIEIALNLTPIRTKEVEWDLGVTFSKNWSKVNKLWNEVQFHQPILPFSPIAPKLP